MINMQRMVLLVQWREFKVSTKKSNKLRKMFEDLKMRTCKHYLMNPTQREEQLARMLHVHRDQIICHWAEKSSTETYPTIIRHETTLNHFHRTFLPPITIFSLTDPWIFGTVRKVSPRCPQRSWWMDQWSQHGNIACRLIYTSHTLQVFHGYLELPYFQISS